MLRVVQVEEISELLLQLPELVKRQEERSADFAAGACIWLHTLEELLTACRLHQAGTIATLRSGLMSVQQGHTPAGLEFRGRPTRSRILNASVSEVLQQAAEIASIIVNRNQTRIADGERAAQQIVAVAMSRGQIANRADGMNNTEYLRALRRNFAASGDLENAFVHLEGLVGPFDALILFDRALTHHLFSVSTAG